MQKVRQPIRYCIYYMVALGHYRDWIDKTPDKKLLQHLADLFNLIIVLPEGELFSYYIDSPIEKGSRFESYIIKDVIAKIDNTYRTNRSSKARDNIRPIDGWLWCFISVSAAPECILCSW